MRLAALLLLFFSCVARAQPAPAMRPPAFDVIPGGAPPDVYTGLPRAELEPGATPAGAGLREGAVLMPNGLAVRRSENTRILPAEAHPGLWSADMRASASIPRRLPMPHLSGLPVEDAKNLADDCSEQVAQGMEKLRDQPESRALLESMFRAKDFGAQAQCLTMGLYARCVQLRVVDVIHARYAAALSASKPKETTQRFHENQWNTEAMHRAMGDLLGQACVADGAYSDAVKALLSSHAKLYPLPGPPGPATPPGKRN